MTDAESARRWRLILGRYAEGSLASRNHFSGVDGDIEQVLGYLYDREYAERGHRLRGTGGSLGPAQLTAINWLAKTRGLFPRSTFERLQTQAVEQYGLTELLADPGTAEGLQPSPELGTALLSLRGRLDSKLEAGVRLVVNKVIEEIVSRIKPSFAAALNGRKDRFRRSFQPSAANFDWRKTIRANLTHYDTESGRLIIDEARFTSRMKRRLPWDVIVCVDQSGSMASSVLYSAVCASILAGLPGINVRLILFDTSVVDLTHLAHDPVEVLMTAQLGGGTDIDQAVRFCETLITTPSRSILVLISDFEEGGSISSLLATVSRLRGAGVKLLGLAALDEEAQAVYDHHVGGRLADRGMQIAALTPDRFADWLAEVMR
ncbi:MAG: VWA domain-containing protein [Propionibacteriaceae bacterium]|jgi:Mg-chelatase subunit ChlD|nr:VWA domain-containing protein [Propionibacteriaceae bacterium]